MGTKSKAFIHDIMPRARWKNASRPNQGKSKKEQRKSAKKRKYENKQNRKFLIESERSTPPPPQQKKNGRRKKDKSPRKRLVKSPDNVKANSVIDAKESPEEQDQKPSVKQVITEEKLDLENVQLPSVPPDVTQHTEEEKSLEMMTDQESVMDISTLKVEQKESEDNAKPINDECSPNK